MNRIAAHGQALAKALELAQRIATKSPAALRFGKAGLRAQAGQTLAQAYETAGRVMVENLLDPDATEGIGAFLDKRAPAWHDPAKASARDDT